MKGRKMKKNNFDSYIKEKIQKKPYLKIELENAGQAIHIAQQLYDLRRSKGLTQKQFAKLIGMSQPNVARLESGDYKSYSLRTLNKAVRVLGSNIEIKIIPINKIHKPSFIFCDLFILAYFLQKLHS